MTTRAEFWSDFDSRNRGDRPDPPLPPHAQMCLRHGKLYRGACPWCSTLSAGGRMPEESENRRYDTPVFRERAARRKRHQPRPEHVAEYAAAKELRAKGMTDYAIAKLLHVAVSTIYGWPR